MVRLSKIRECPNDLKEAISSLIFASARCGDIPELFVIRKLFGKRYGEKFATSAVELFPGNLVNKQLTENLSGKYVTEDLKYRMVDEIARDNNGLQQNVLAIEYYPDWQEVQLEENKGYRLVENDAQINASISESKVHPSDIQEIERDVKFVNSSPISKPYGDSSAIVSIVQKYPQYIMSYPMQKKVVEVDIPKLLSSVNSSLRNKDEKLALISSAEMVDYVDEIEECRFSLPKDGACKDEMLLKFNSSGLSRRRKTQFGCDKSHIDQDEQPSETLSTRSSRKNKRAPRKRSRRRSTSIESLGIVDTGYMIYYQKPCKSPSTHKYVSSRSSRKDKKKPMLHSFSEKSVQSRETKDSNQPGLFLAEEASLPQHSEQKFEPQMKEVSKFSVQPCLEQEFVADQIRSEDRTKREKFNQNIRGCSLDQPCYFCIYDDKDYLETQFMHDECYHCGPFFEVGNGNNETKEEIIVTSNVSNPRTNGSLTRVETEVPYLRAMTMPQERHRKGKDKMLRTFSCPYQHPNHVHPKLPDYDDIAAKFTALRREHLQIKDCSRK
ncbi:hypothetical protein TSUD_104800 [Trifolium subterraneum]|uniref:Uncharacterized protein n=1 Tax=Trifolium subterraneum TaxID=3900 RepID=A0A2Z6MU02_TRISU|nr:hypothetical protein TSUD_104800 [Trifolium subterraneum]